MQKPTVKMYAVLWVNKALTSDDGDPKGSIHSHLSEPFKSKSAATRIAKDRSRRSNDRYSKDIRVSVVEIQEVENVYSERKVKNASILGGTLR